MRLSLSVAKQIAGKLGHYVYIYVDPTDKSVFYVGKGQDYRALTHLENAGNPELKRRIKKLKTQGLEPQIELLAHSLKNRDVALQIESAVIESLGCGKLCNGVRGHGAQLCRMPIEDVVAHFSKLKAEITEPSILIRINQYYEPGLSDVRLYDNTRSCWPIAKKRREELELAFSVYKGTIREVYEITGWHKGGSTFCTYRNGLRDTSAKNRWEFVGVIAKDSIRDKYLSRSVKHHHTKGAQNPILYLNCK
jgi:hypothetical protein